MQLRLAPERVEVACKNGVSPRLVDVQNDPAQLRAGGSQRLRKRLRQRPEAARRDDADNRVAPVHGLAAEHMAHDAFARLLVIGGNAVLAHKVRDGSRGADAQLGLDQTVPDGDQLVAALPEEAEGRRGCSSSS